MWHTLLHWPEGERLFLQWEGKVLWSRASDWKEWKERAWKEGGSIRKGERVRETESKKRFFRCRKNFNFVLQACSWIGHVYLCWASKEALRTHTHIHGATFNSACSNSKWHFFLCCLKAFISVVIFASGVIIPFKSFSALF